MPKHTGKNDIERTKSLMGALGRMPPKQHKDMMVGKRKKNEKSKKKKRPA